MTGGAGPPRRGAPAGDETRRAGLCATCRHVRRVPAARSVFYLCQRARVDERFRKYPALPVIACVGYEAEDDDPGR